MGGTLSRRRFLGVSGALALGAGLGGCGGGDEGSSGGGGGALTWWDHQVQLESAKKRIFEEFAADPGGMKVDYLLANPEKMGQQLQIAKQTGDLPDIHSNAGLGPIPPPQLISEGWIAPLDLSDEAKTYLEGKVIDGLHVFDGKIYSFPIFNFRVYPTVNWFNRTLVEQAGLDPDAPPTSYDEFRAAAKAVQDNTDAAGWTWNVGMPIRTSDQIHYLAQAAGFEGFNGRLFRTGEVAFDSEPYLNAIEFLLSLKQDGLMSPGAESWVDTDARGRWASGAAGYYFDGPWCPGVILPQSPEFGESLGAGPILTPEPDMPVRTYHNPQPGEYWLTPDIQYAAEANQLLSDYFATPDYSLDVANTMSQPPIVLDAVAESDAHPEYKKLIEMYAEQVFLAPYPIARNLEITKVQQEEKQVNPDIGTIIQGAFTGDVDDLAGALKKLSDDTMAEWERSVKAAQDKGAEVDLDDWAFPDWRPGADYGV
ncbi:ABC transporter substrate-binding protein [Phytoactinopolyspora halotolerans]|uniref:Extracellular solute-binding protein n=1 Tax=Phytoactinopolyspora halotolerans TaxID=1981512 RepID=A0A6L9S3D5_9ACTN|nr:extracellular solute-binding protein [Phytoactinopolyspora halotolerans]NED99566.1 extracellular solute-binding protein [Phytoactinopolyspora halotolerans]